MAKRAVIVVADGCEDIETVCPIDVLTRVGVEVTVASLENRTVKCSWGSKLQADISVDEVGEDFDAIIFPGGMPNAATLASDERVRKLAMQYFEKRKLVASICASPAHLLGEATGILKGRRATGDPSFNDKLAAAGAEVTDEAVTIEGNVITARGPGAALAFALKVAQYLVGDEKPRVFAAKWGVDIP